jgi:hypothetical protein
VSTTDLIELGKLAGALVAIAGLFALLAKAVRAMLRTVRKLSRLADEVLGDEDRPGWGKRLTAVEAKIATVLAEVKPNGGGSMRDEVRRIADATGANQP